MSVWVYLGVSVQGVSVQGEGVSIHGVSSTETPLYRDSFHRDLSSFHRDHPFAVDLLPLVNRQTGLKILLSNNVEGLVDEEQ